MIRRLKVLAATFICLLSVSSSFAQLVKDPTEWDFKAKKTGVNTYELTFEVKLEDGWHIFSQKPGDDMLIPPSFRFEDIDNVALKGEIAEDGKLITKTMDGFDNPINYYEHKVGFIATVNLVHKGPMKAITGEYEYQLCNDRICLPPKKKQFTFKVPD
jgi:DsbC/DsbD-like thiol-disulfide interchange protein